MSKHIQKDCILASLPNALAKIFKMKSAESFLEWGTLHRQHRSSDSCIIKVGTIICVFMYSCNCYGPMRNEHLLLICQTGRSKDWPWLGDNEIGCWIAKILWFNESQFTFLNKKEVTYIRAIDNHFRIWSRSVFFSKPYGSLLKIKWKPQFFFRHENYSSLRWSHWSRHFNSIHLSSYPH